MDGYTIGFRNLWNKVSESQISVCRAGPEMQNAELRMQNCGIISTLRAAYGGCAPKRACGRSPTEMVLIVGEADTIILYCAA